MKTEEGRRDEEQEWMKERLGETGSREKEYWEEEDSKKINEC